MIMTDEKHVFQSAVNEHNSFQLKPALAQLTLAWMYVLLCSCFITCLGYSAKIKIKILEFWSGGTEFFKNKKK